MQQRILGKELQVSKMGYGAMGLSGIYGDANDKESITLLQKAYEFGINFFDTADMYGNGHNETIVGTAFSSAAMRENVIITSKGAISWDPKHPEAMQISNKPDYIKKACDASLQRLNMDYIDLYYLHRIDPEVAIEDSVGALVDLIAAGKIRYIRLSEASVATIKRAHAVHPITALQNEYSLWTREVEENGILEICRELNIGFVPYSPLGRGLLTGSIKSNKTYTELDFRPKCPRFQEGNIEINLALVEQLKQIAESKQLTTAQLSLAWVLVQGEHIVPIPGTKSVSRLQENIAAAAVELTTAEVQMLNILFAKDKVKGERYPEALLKFVNH